MCPQHHFSQFEILLRISDKIVQVGFRFFIIHTLICVPSERIMIRMVCLGRVMTSRREVAQDMLLLDFMIGSAR